MVTILRIGHRIDRDKRITTHLLLTARALGASKVYIAGEWDEKIIESVTKVVDEWGNSFYFEFIDHDQWEFVVNHYKSIKFPIIHLTMYGENLPKFLSENESSLDNILIVLGGEKIPSQVYKMADWNIGVTNQPHSEVAALAIFLYSIYPELNKYDKIEAKKKIIPSLEGNKHLDMANRKSEK